MGQGSGQREIFIKIESGQTQSQELFDYSTQQNRMVNTQPLPLSSYLVQQDEDMVCQILRPQIAPLFKLSLGPCELQMQRVPRGDLWRVLQQGQQYPLQIGDIVKLGKIKLKLKEIVQDEKDMTERDPLSMSMYQQQQTHLQVKSISGQSHHSEEKQCRICFDGNSQAGNPLISLCKCAGSVKYIHFACLRDWVSNSNVVRRQNNVSMFYSFKQTRCELCQQFYQPQFTYRGDKYMLLDLENAPLPPYALFQGGQQEQDGRYSFLMVNLAQPEITIGRNSNCNVVMKQISVSRNHCQLVYQHRQLFIKDKGSKFGTLIQMGQQVEFSLQAGLQIQYESKLITIQQKSKITCCCAQSDAFRLKIINSEDIQSQQAVA